MKRILIIICILSCALYVKAQDIPISNSQKNKMTTSPPKSNTQNKGTLDLNPFVGGGFGASFGTGYSTIYVNPEVGIQPVEWLRIGIGGYYQYGFGNQYRSNTWGISPYLQPHFRNILLHVEYNFRQDRVHEDPVGTAPTFNTYTYNSVVAGAGYISNISDKLALYGLLLIRAYEWSPSYTVTQNYNPYFRVGAIVRM